MGWYERTVMAVADTRMGASVFMRVATRIDRMLVPLTRGRLSSCLGTRYHARHLLLLTTTGARSGRHRIAPLLYFADGDAIVVVASNAGYPRHPAWYHNLRAHPEATVYTRGRTTTCVAREAAGAERARLWARAVELHPSYATYQRRAPRREIPLMILAPKK